MSDEWDSGAIESRGRARQATRARERARARALPRPNRIWARSLSHPRLVWARSSASRSWRRSKSAHVLAAPGGLLTALGRMTGMVGTYFMLVTILIIGRLPVVERAVGQDRLVAWHRRLGPSILLLLGAHAVFITLGYAQALRPGCCTRSSSCSKHPGMLGAGSVSPCSSWPASLRTATCAQDALRDLVDGPSLHVPGGGALVHPPALGRLGVAGPSVRAGVLDRPVAATAGVVIAYRFGLPILRSLRHDCG